MLTVLQYLVTWMSLALQLNLQQPTRWSVKRARRQDSNMLKLMLFGETRIRAESASATGVSSICMVRSIADSLYRHVEETDLTLNMLKGLTNLEEKALWFGECFSSEGVVPLVNTNLCLNLAKRNVTPSLEASPNQQWRCLRHTAKRVKNYFEQENVQVMKGPAQSPALNTIENHWHIIGEKVCKEQPSTVMDLWNKIE